MIGSRHVVVCERIVYSTNARRHPTTQQNSNKRQVQLSPVYSSSSAKGGGGPAAFPNKLKTCTKDDPTTTTRKKKINVLGTGLSSSRSAALPVGTAPRLVMFLSNRLLRLRMFRGSGYGRGEERKRRMENCVRMIVHQT